MKKRDIGTLTRTLVLFIALLNQILVMYGFSPLPFSDHEVEMFISVLFTIVASINSWWRDNHISNEARDKQQFLDENYKK